MRKENLLTIKAFSEFLHVFNTRSFQSFFSKVTSGVIVLEK